MNTFSFNGLFGLKKINLTAVPLPVRIRGHPAPDSNCFGLVPLSLPSYNRQGKEG
jgi:hypothetical protein